MLGRYSGTMFNKNGIIIKYMSLYWHHVIDLMVTTAVLVSWYNDEPN